MRSTTSTQPDMVTQPDTVWMATLLILALLTPGGFLNGQQSLEMRGSANIDVCSG